MSDSASSGTLCNSTGWCKFKWAKLTRMSFSGQLWSSVGMWERSWIVIKRPLGERNKYGQLVFGMCVFIHLTWKHVIKTFTGVIFPLVFLCRGLYTLYSMYKICRVTKLQIIHITRPAENALNKFSNIGVIV